MNTEKTNLENEKPALSKGDVSGLLPVGFISVDEKLPLHRQSISIFTSTGRILEGVCKFRMFKLQWDIDFNDQKAMDNEYVLGWKGNDR